MAEMAAQQGMREGPGWAAEGVLVISKVQGSSVATRLRYGYPLRMAYIPKCVTDSRIDCAWVYILSFGGGLLGGDRIDINCTVEADCNAVLATQGSTKIFKMPRSAGVDHSEGTYQRMRVSVGPNALLCLLPEPYTCFRGSRYKQIQEFEVAPSASLVLVDWYTSGRMGRGESWAFTRLESIIEIRSDGKLLMLDPLLLEDCRETKSTVRERMQGYECLCLVVIMGPKVKSLLEGVAAAEGRRMKWQSHHHTLTGANGHPRAGGGVESALQPGGVVSSCCKVHGDMVVVKAAGRTTEAVRTYLADLLNPLGPMVGRPPYSWS